MKQIAILAFALLLTGGSTLCAQDTIQTEKTSKKLIIKNRLFTDFFYSYWLGLPEGVKQQGFNRGFNASFLFDLPLRKESPFSFGLGVGVCSHNLYSNAYSIINDNYDVVMVPLPETTKYSVNKLSFTYLHIPLEFRYFHPTAEWKITCGVRVGLMADIHSKYVGANCEVLQYDGNSNRDVHIKNNKIPNRTKVPVELTFHTGWKYFDLNASYMLTKMFEEGNPQVHPFSVGLTIAIY